MKFYLNINKYIFVYILEFYININKYIYVYILPEVRAGRGGHAQMLAMPE